MTIEMITAEMELKELAGVFSWCIKRRSTTFLISDQHWVRSQRAQLVWDFMKRLRRNDSGGIELKN